MLRRPTLIFSGTTLLVVAGVFFLIIANTPLTFVQMVGTGIGFILAWLGLAYAGSEAIQAMIRRRARIASQAGAQQRSGAVARRLIRLGEVKPPPGQATMSQATDTASQSVTRRPAASAEGAAARAELATRRFERDGAIPELPLQREAASSDLSSTAGS